MSSNRRQSVQDTSPSKPPQTTQRKTSGYRQELPTIQSGHGYGQGQYGQPSGPHHLSMNPAGSQQPPQYNMNPLVNPNVHPNMGMQMAMQNHGQTSPRTQVNSRTYSNPHHHYQTVDIDEDIDEQDENENDNDDDAQMILDDTSDREAGPSHSNGNGEHAPKKRKYSVTDQGTVQGGGQTKVEVGGQKEKKRRQVQSCSECRRR